MIPCPKCKVRLSPLAIRGHFSCPNCKEELTSNIGLFGFGIALVVFVAGPFLVTEVCKGGYRDFGCWIPVEVVFAVAVSCVAYLSNMFLKVKEDN